MIIALIAGAIFGLPAAAYAVCFLLLARTAAEAKRC
jgi:hypothetical protein